MRVVPKSPLGHALGWCISKGSDPPGSVAGTYVSFFVRAAFDITPPGSAPSALTRPVVPAGDTPYDDASQGLRYPSDYVPRKPYGEVIVVGTAHPPAGRSATNYHVRIAVGEWRKQLNVYGDRMWNTGGLVDSPGPADIAGAIPLSFAHAWGGAGVASNPLGFGDKGLRVPNLERPDQPIVGRHPTKGDPAGLGPIPPDWPQRRRYAGVPGRAGVASWWPWTPPQFDERFWMATLPDQWVDGYFRGDEAVEISNLDPEHADWRTMLPGQRARVFVLRLPRDAPLTSLRRGRLADAEATFMEVPLVLDTVFIDANAGEMTLVWRGRTPTRSPKLLDILGVSFGLEPLGEDRADTHYLAALFAEENEMAVKPAADGNAIKAQIEAAIAERVAAQARIEAEMETQLSDVKAKVAAELAMARAGHGEAVEELVAAFRPDNEEQIRATSRLLSSDPFADQAPPLGPSMTDVAADLRRQADSMLSLQQGRSESMLPGTLDAVRRQSDVLRESADGLEQAASMQAGFMAEVAEFKGKLLADFPAGLLVEKVVEPGATLDLEAIRRDGLADHDIRGVDFSEMDLSGVSFRGVQAAGASFRGAKLVKADFTRANLTKVDLCDADLSGAILEHADLTDAAVAGATWRDARLTGTRLAGLALSNADFSRSSGTHADFTRADLSAGVFREATLDRPTFREARLDGTDFTGATLRKADFGTTSCRDAIFDDACLPNLRAREAANFTGARLRRLRADDASWTTSILDRADFQDADLRRADFSECVLDGTNFDRCDLANAVFVDSEVHAATLTNANLLRTSFDRATIVDVRFDGSSLFEAGFWDASLAGVTFKGCDVSRASLPTPP